MLSYFADKQMTAKTLPPPTFIYGKFQELHKKILEFSENKNKNVFIISVISVTQWHGICCRY